MGAGPDNTTWHTADPMKCIPAAAPQPAAPPAQQAPPPQQAPPHDQQRSDRDGDGLYDDDEIDVYGTNPKEADTDGDDRSDGQEVSDNTDPNNQFD